MKRVRFGQAKHSRPRLWTPERVSEMRRLAEEGLTAKEAAQRLGMSWQSVRATSWQHGIHFHGPTTAFLKAHAGNRFAEARVAKGLSLMDVELDTGIAHSTIRRWENGGWPRNRGAIEKIADEYGVTVAWLKGEED